MRRRTTLLSVLVSGVLVAAMIVGLAGPAQAGTGFIDQWNKHDVIVNGQIWVYNDVSEWSLTVRTKQSVPVGKCAYLHLQIDVNNGSDPVRHSGTVCGPGSGTVTFNNDPRYIERHGGTRGVRLLSVGPSGTHEVIYVRE